MNLYDFKPKKAIKYKYSPDDVVFHITKVLSVTANEVSFLGRWSAPDIEQEMTLTKETAKNWEETK